MRSHTLSLRTGIDTHLLEWGHDDDSLTHTVILVHGFLDLAWGWERTAASGLDGAFHIVAPDMRGHGDSGRVGAGGYYHFMDYLADLHELIGAVGRDRVSLVGHSMGGSICGYYAGAYPERVHRLALLEGTGPPESPTPAPHRVRAWITGWERARRKTPRVHGTIEEAAARLRGNDSLLDEALSLELARHGTNPVDGGFQFKHDPVHMTLGPYAFRVDVAEEFWRQITCPVLLVEGSESVFRHAVDENGRRHAAFSSATFAELAGAGHMMQRHQPAALARLLGDFLER